MTDQHSIRDDTVRHERSPAEPGLAELARLVEDHAIRIEAFRFAWQNIAQDMGMDRETDGKIGCFAEIALETLERDANHLSDKIHEWLRKSRPTSVVIDRGGEYRIPGPASDSPNNGWGRAATRVVRSGAVEIDGEAYTAGELPALEGACLEVRMPLRALRHERAPGAFLPDGRFISLQKVEG